MEKVLACLATDGHPLAVSHGLEPSTPAHVLVRGAAVGVAGEITCALRGWARFDGESGCGDALAARMAAAYRDTGVDVAERIRR